MLLDRALSEDPNARDNEDPVSLYRKALDICSFIQSRLVDSDGSVSSDVLPSHFHRFQNVYRTSSNLERLINERNVQQSMHDLTTAVELAIRPASLYNVAERFTFRDLVVAACIASYLILSPETSVPAPILEALLTTDGPRTSLEAIQSGGLLRPVHASGEHMVQLLLQEGCGVIPTLVLRPDEILSLPELLFPNGVLPALCRDAKVDVQKSVPSEDTRQQAHHMTSSLLVLIAKMIQDGASSIEILGESQSDIPSSPSLVLLLYYLALSLSPSPSLYNNVGVVLSGISSLSMRNMDGDQGLPNRHELAKLYYETGLQQDPTSPHLLTNYGSLLKDQGNTTEAIR